MVTLHGQGTSNAEQEAIAALLPAALIGRLWALVALLLFVGVALGASRLPSYASGQGILLTPASPSEPVRLVALFPASDHATLRAGQPLFVEVASQEWVQVRIEQVEPTFIDPTAAQQRYALSLTAPAVLVMARWPAAAPPPVAGAKYVVQAEMGSRTLLSLLLPDLAGGGE